MELKLRELRIQKKLTQEELSVKANVSRQTISGLENGKPTNTTTDTLKWLADALGTTVGALF